MGTGHLLFLEPNFKERLWGGSQLATTFPFSVPTGRIGEAWLISGHQNGASVIKNGTFAGMSLANLYAQRRDLFGSDSSPVFPLLVKFIDSAEALSVQVHPNDADAFKMANELGKSECWYVLSASAKSYLVLGHRAQTKDEMRHLISENQWNTLLKTVPVHPGDFVYLPAGTIHAIGPDLLILETQQSSDVTYRLYDYDRKDAKGNLRELHLDQAIAVATVPDIGVPLSHYGSTSGTVTMIDTPDFTVEKWVLHGKKTHPNLDGRYYLCTVIDGFLLVNGEKTRKGESFLISSDTEAITTNGDAELIISYRKKTSL